MATKQPGIPYDTPVKPVFAMCLGIMVLGTLVVRCEAAENVVLHETASAYARWPNGPNQDADFFPHDPSPRLD